MKRLHTIPDIDAGRIPSGPRLNMEPMQMQPFYYGASNIRSYYNFKPDEASSSQLKSMFNVIKRK